MAWTIPEIFWTASYFLFFWGSVSFGYLILRFSVPDIRSASRQARLGLSGITGMAIFGLSFVVSIIVGREYLLVSIPLIALLTIGMLEMKNLLVAGATVHVAVPVATVTERPHPRAVRVPGRVPTPPAKGAKKPAAKAEKMERPHFDVVIEKPAPPPEIGPGEVRPEHEKKVVSERRRRYQERRQREKAGAAAPPAAGRPMEMPAVVTPEEVGEVRSRARRRYLEHRGGLIEQVKTDLTRPREPEGDIRALGDLGTGLDLSDLNKVSSLDELRDLANVETPEEITISSLAGLAEIEDLPKEKGMGCPHCHSTKSSMVYCPYCGKGFCSDCSGKVGGKEDMNFFECPSCGKEVIVKKQQAKK